MAKRLSRRCQSEFTNEVGPIKTAFAAERQDGDDQQNPARGFIKAAIEVMKRRSR